MHDLIEQHRAAIALLCRHHAVHRLAVFGSAARGTDFDPDRSDADFLVESEPASGLVALERHLGLAECLERPVDLVERDAVEESRNYIRRRQILADALEQAFDALVTALSFYTDDGRKLPAPSPSRGRPIVAVPALIAAKLALHEAMLSGGVSNVELARRLGTDEKAVRRLRDPLHGSRIEAVEAALRALGKRLEVSVRAMA